MNFNVRNQQYFLPKPKEVPPAHCVSNFGGDKERRPSWVLWLSLATGEHLRVQSSPQGQQQTKTQDKDDDNDDPDGHPRESIYVNWIWHTIR